MRAESQFPSIIDGLIGLSYGLSYNCLLDCLIGLSHGLLLLDTLGAARPPCRFHFIFVYGCVCMSVNLCQYSMPGAFLQQSLPFFLVAGLLGWIVALGYAWGLLALWPTSGHWGCYWPPFRFHFILCIET